MPKFTRWIWTSVGLLACASAIPWFEAPLPLRPPRSRRPPPPMGRSLRDRQRPQTLRRHRGRNPCRNPRGKLRAIPGEAVGVRGVEGDVGVRGDGMIWRAAGECGLTAGFPLLSERREFPERVRKGRVKTLPPNGKAWITPANVCLRRLRFHPGNTLEFDPLRPPHNAVHPILLRSGLRNLPLGIPECAKPQESIGR